MCNEGKCQSVYVCMQGQQYTRHSQIRLLLLNTLACLIRVLGDGNVMRWGDDDRTHLTERGWKGQAAIIAAQPPRPKSRRKNTTRDAPNRPGTDLIICIAYTSMTRTTVPGESMTA